MTPYSSSSATSRRVGARLLEHVLERVQRAPRSRTDGAPAGAAHGFGRRRGGRGDVARRCAPAGELLTDDAQRQELVALQAQDRAQPRHVAAAVEAIAARRAARRQQLLVLEVADLRDRDVRELLAPAPCRPRRSSSTCLRRWVPPSRSASMIAPVSVIDSRNVSLYLPICSSSPSSSCWAVDPRAVDVGPVERPEVVEVNTSPPRATSSAWSRDTVTSSRNTSQSGAGRSSCGRDRPGSSRRRARRRPG